MLKWALHIIFFGALPRHIISDALTKSLIFNKIVDFTTNCLSSITKYGKI